MSDSLARQSGPQGLEGLSALRPQKLPQTVEGLLRDMILSGGLGPGERLNEVAIAEQLKISRSPIREAIRALTAQGLVRFVPGRGAYVSDFDIDSVRDISEVRIALETRAARLAAMRATKDQLRHISDVLKSADEALTTGEMENLLHHSDEAIQTGAGYPAGIDFHHAVIAASHNARLAAAADELATQFRLARARTGREAAWAPEAHQEHIAIFQALQRGDADGASAAMESHLVNSTNAIVAHIQSTTPLTHP